MRTNTPAMTTTTIGCDDCEDDCDHDYGDNDEDENQDENDNNDEYDDDSRCGGNVGCHDCYLYYF